MLFSTVLLFSFACGNQYSGILPVVNKTTIRKKKKVLRMRNIRLRVLPVFAAGNAQKFA